MRLGRRVTIQGIETIRSRLGYPAKEGGLSGTTLAKVRACFLPRKKQAQGTGYAHPRGCDCLPAKHIAEKQPVQLSSTEGSCW